MARLYTDRAETTVAVAINDSATSITVADGANFPSPTGGDYAILTLEEGSTFERITLTARTANVLTVTRASEGTTAASFTTAATVSLRTTASALTNAFPPYLEMSFSNFSPMGHGESGDSLLAMTLQSSGTQSNPAPATTNRFTIARRKNVTTAASAGSSASFRSYDVHGLRQYGFFWQCESGIADAVLVADARLFVGLSSTSSEFGNVNPTTLLNLIGFGCDAGETSLKVIYNDGSGTASTVALGASFPTNTISTDWYRFQLWAEPNAPVVKYKVTNLHTGVSTSGDLTTDLPSSTTALRWHAWRNNGSTASAAALAVGMMRSRYGGFSS